MFALLLLSRALAAEGPVVYAERDGRPLTLQVWSPQGDGLHAGVLLLHGGGWKYGDLTEGVEDQARAAAAAGLVAVSANYRLSTEAVWPAQIDDAACALRWMRTNAAALSLDPQRVAVVGHSAGGHLALMLAEDPERAGDCPLPADAVAAVASLAGPSDFARFYSSTLWWGRKMARELLGWTRAQGWRAEAATFADVSPLSFIDPEGPPVLQVVGGEDPLVPGAVAASFDAALRAAGRDSVVRTVPDAGHNDLNNAEIWLPWVLRELGLTPP